MITLSLLDRATYMYGVVLHAHPVRGESHNQRNTTGDLATIPMMNPQLECHVILLSYESAKPHLFRKEIATRFLLHCTFS